MKKYKLGDVLEEFHSGNNIKAADIKDVGEYPVFGANGLRGYTDRYNCDGDVAIIGRQGAYCGNVKFFSGKAYYTEHAVIAKPKKGFDAKYLACKLPFYQLEKYQGQSAQPGLSVGTLSLIEVELPSYENQKEVALVLSTLDQRIENLRAQNRVLEQTAKTIYDYTFLQCAGHQTTYNKNLNRNIPTNWEVKTIGEILDKVSATTKIETKLYQQSGKYPVIDQSTNFIAGYTDDESAVIRKTPAVFFGDHTRIVKMINFEFARGSDGTQILYSKEQNVGPFYLYFAVKAIDLSNMGYARHFKFLKDKPIAIPDKNTSDSFEKAIRPLFDKILINRKQIEALTTQRNTLLPLLMTGQVEV